MSIREVLQYCKPAFMLNGGAQAEKAWDGFYASWHSIVASPPEKEFQERLANFERTYATKYIEAVGYIRTTWLDPFKERIVKP
jgi:hypothetical protein